LGDGPPGFPRGFPCPVVLGNVAKEPPNFSPTGLSPSLAVLSRSLQLSWWFVTPRPDRSRIKQRPATPRRQRLRAITPARFGLFRFRSPLLAESLLLSLPGGTEMVHFPPFASVELCVHPTMTGHDSRRVSPFGRLRIKACLRLPEAFRSLPRPSSPLCAKASTVHP
jgi:hypothetical protein